MEYSGRTTAYEHKREDWAEYKGPFQSCIIQQTVFDVQWSDCPVEVEEEVKKLWRANELRNDDCYYSWNTTEHGEDEKSADEETWPIIAEYLKSKGVEKCLIHWWW